MQTTDPALFACYVLYIYFNGRNILRLEREMRSLGYRSFHRRNLYRRGDSPGWIEKYNWNATMTGAASIPACESAGTVSDAKAQAETRPVGSVPSEKQEPQQQDQNNSAPETPHSALNGSHFKEWLKTVSPNMTWTWRHQQVILEQLERVTRGECKRLMIFLPPRHGKSELVTVRYTAWRMQRDPSMNVILGSYNQRLADRFSRKIRKVIADAEVGQTSQFVLAGRSTPENDPSNSAYLSQEGQLAPADSNHRATQSSQTPSNSETSGGKPAFPTGIGQVDSARRTVSRGEPACSPFPFVSTKPANTVSEWETTAGGGFRSVGVGSGVTGFGASLIVIDDPIKSRAEAESETYRERVWDWFTDDLYTRLEPDGAIVLIQTRWHEDDLAGRLLRESAEGGEQWDVVNLPAISEVVSTAETRSRGEVEGGSGFSELTVADRSEQENTPLLPSDPFTKQDSADENSPLRLRGSAVQNSPDWRQPGQPLCPERFNKQALERIRRRLGEYSFAALYQQRPTPAAGGLFKRSWFSKIVPFAPHGLKWKRAYDLAVSTRTSADYTASFRCAFDKEGNLYIAGGMRARLEYPEQRRYIIDRIKNEPDTEHGIELALHGQALLQDLRREPGVRGYLLRGIRAEHDKYTRALAWAPLAEEGKVILVRNSAVSSPHGSKGSAGPPQMRSAPDSSTTTIPQSALRSPNSNWIPDFLDEVCSFPSAAHDDQVDAVSLAVQMLKRPRRGFHAF